MKIENFLAGADFVKLMQKHCFEIIQSLITQKSEFGIVAKTKFIDFDPPLPEHLDLKKNPYALFALAGYTFESIDLDESKITFHAGFGVDDFATFVSIDLGAITQIQIENDIIFVNFSHYERKKDDKELTQNSINIFLKNPKNKDSLKK